MKAIQFCIKCYHDASAITLHSIIIYALITQPALLPAKAVLVEGSPASLKDTETVHFSVSDNVQAQINSILL